MDREAEGNSVPSKRRTDTSFVKAQVYRIVLLRITPVTGVLLP